MGNAALPEQTFQHTLRCPLCFVAMCMPPTLSDRYSRVRVCVNGHMCESVCVRAHACALSLHFLTGLSRPTPAPPRSLLCTALRRSIFGVDLILALPPAQVL